MKPLCPLSLLLSRLLFAALFLPAGIRKLMDFEGTVGYITTSSLPLPMAAASIAIAVEVLGGIALLLGFKIRCTALALAAFTLVASLFFHNYWAMPEASQMMQQLMFMKNMGIIGGLLALAACSCSSLTCSRSTTDQSYKK